jgi:hypothetical protein
MKTILAIAVLVTGSLSLLIHAQSQAASSSNSAALASINKKIAYVQQNGALAKPDPKPTEFTEQEINAFLASNQVQLPQGVQSVKMQGQPEVITGTARVDFDQVKAGSGSSNPLLSMFSGVHDLTVVAHARGTNHTGYVQVDSASLDGTEIPHFALEMFIEKFVTPKYPGVGMNSQFALPAKIDTAKVGQQKLTITQK